MPAAPDPLDPPSPPSRRSRWRAALSDALSGAEHDYTTGSLARAITLLAIPMVLEMAMESLFAVCDVYFVARLGPDAVAAVGLTESVLTLLYALAIGLSIATTATVARRIGERDKPGAVRAATAALALGLGIAAVLGPLGALFADDVLRLMGASAATVEIGGGYTAVMLGGNAVILLLFLQNGIFRGAGDAVVAMRSLWLANAINIVLDPCLIFGWGPFPELGVTGAAVATTIGRGCGVLYQFHALRRGRTRVHLRGPDFRLDLGVLVGMVRVSLGSIGQLLVATASWVALMRILSPFGSQAVAGYTIAVRLIVFALLPAWGLSNAAATLVGQNLGAGQPDRAERSVWLTGAANTVFLGVVTLLFLLLAGPLVGLFTDDPAVAAIGTEALRVISGGYVLYAWGMVLTQAFNGAGDTWTPTRINLLSFWACQIPLAWILARVLELGPSGVFWSVLIAESLLTVIATVAFRRGTWKRQRV